MKKFSKVFLVVAASLLMTVSFSSCAAILSALFGTDMTVTAKSSVAKYDSSKLEVLIKHYDENGVFIKDEGTITLTVNNGKEFALKNYMKATSCYSFVITKIDSTTVSIPVEVDEFDSSNYVSSANVEGHPEIFTVAGNGEYTINLKSDTTATLTGTMKM